jgi:hypothetical protein
MWYCKSPRRITSRNHKPGRDKTELPSWGQRCLLAL